MFVCCYSSFFFIFFFNDPATTEIYTLSLHDALPIYPIRASDARSGWGIMPITLRSRLSTPAMSLTEPLGRSEEHTSELQSRFDLVCRLLLEKKKKNTHTRCS